MNKQLSCILAMLCCMSLRAGKLDALRARRNTNVISTLSKKDKQSAQVNDDIKTHMDIDQAFKEVRKQSADQESLKPAQKAPGGPTPMRNAADEYRALDQETATLNKADILNEELDKVGEPEAQADQIELRKAQEVLENIDTPQEKDTDIESLVAQLAAETDESITFNFENASLEQLVTYVGEVFGYQFIIPDALDPVPSSEKSLKGNLISFKTHRPLSKKEAWNLFLTFLNMASFSVVNDPLPNTFRITTTEVAKRSSIPTYIGIDFDKFPPTVAGSDQLIRYIYFIENSTSEAIEPVINQIRSAQSEIYFLREHRAFLIIDTAYNIGSLMKVVFELDKVSMPQSMSVLKLKRADADDVAKLYKSLMGGDEKAQPQNRFLQKKPSTSHFFPENVRVIAEGRTNSLILLGPIDAIKKIEDFVIQYVDVELDKTFSPLFVYTLRYADAETVANIMTEVTGIGKSSGLRDVGAVRGVDKFMRPMTFTPEKVGNRIIVKGDYEDFIKAKEIMDRLDEPQQQVAIEVLILSIDVNEVKILGAQMRAKQPCGTTGLFGGNVAWQTSGLFTGPNSAAQGIVQNINGLGNERLLGNLLNLVTTAASGNTIVSLGDITGAFAIIQALETINSTQTLANPYLLATNRTPAKVSVGITQRVVASEVIQTGSPAQQTFKDESANLTVNVTPLINSDGMITLDLNIIIENFLGVFDPNNVQKNSRTVVTKTIVADKEVIAIGGLMQDQTSNSQSKLPILGDIPLLGWLFKNKSKEENRNNLLILVSTEIVRPDHKGGNNFTLRHVNETESMLSKMYSPTDRIDPINRWFFEDRQTDAGQTFDRFIFDARHNIAESVLGDSKRKRKRVKQASVESQGNRS